MKSYQEYEECSIIIIYLPQIAPSKMFIGNYFLFVDIEEVHHDEM